MLQGTNYIGRAFFLFTIFFRTMLSELAYKIRNHESNWFDNFILGIILLSAILENRQFIGIEKNEDVLLHKVKPVDYIKICTDRIQETLKRKEIEESTLRLFNEPIAKYHTLNYKNGKAKASPAIY